jgi:hypothetical protein
MVPNDGYESVREGSPDIAAALLIQHFWVPTIKTSPDADRLPGPIIQLDLSTRPDVADLFRVLDVEGFPRTERAWGLAVRRGHPLVLLAMKVRRPVQCDFEILFSMRRHRVLLDAIVLSGEVQIAAMEHPLSISGVPTASTVLDCDVESLREVLADPRLVE